MPLPVISSNRSHVRARLVGVWLPPSNNRVHKSALRPSLFPVGLAENLQHVVDPLG